MPEDHELAAVQDVTLIPVTLHFNETPDKSENMTFSAQDTNGLDIDGEVFFCGLTHEELTGMVGKQTGEDFTVESVGEPYQVEAHPKSQEPSQPRLARRSRRPVTARASSNRTVMTGRRVWDENGGLFIHGYHHDGGVDVEVRQLTDAGEEALDVIEDAWYGEPFTSGGKEYDGSPESVDTAMRDLWEDPDLCPTPRYMELAFGCPAEEYEAPAIDPLLEAAEFTPSAIMSAEVAPGAVTATVHDVSGVPYEVPADVLNGLKDAVRISDRAATIEPSASLTIDGWNQKLDDFLWALDFEDRNGVPPQLSDWLARDAEGEKGNESAKTSPVSLKTAAEEAHAVSTMLSKKNGGTDEQDGKDDLQRHMIPSEMRIPSQNDHHRAPSLSDIAAETRAASAAMETNIASRIDRERDAR